MITYFVQAPATGLSYYQYYVVYTNIIFTNTLSHEIKLFEKLNHEL